MAGSRKRRFVGFKRPVRRSKKARTTKAAKRRRVNKFRGLESKELRALHDHTVKVKTSDIGALMHLETDPFNSKKGGGDITGNTSWYTTKGRDKNVRAMKRELLKWTSGSPITLGTSSAFELAEMKGNTSVDPGTALAANDAEGSDVAHADFNGHLCLGARHRLRFRNIGASSDDALTIIAYYGPVAASEDQGGSAVMSYKEYQLLKKAKWVTKLQLGPANNANHQPANEGIINIGWVNPAQFLEDHGPDLRTLEENFAFGTYRSSAAPPVPIQLYIAGWKTWSQAAIDTNELQLTVEASFDMVHWHAVQPRADDD